MNRFKNCAKKGFISGFKTWWWIAKITAMATFIVSLLQWSGIIDSISRMLSPCFEIIGLSTEAAIVFITSAIANIYAGIGVMATLSIEFREATIIAVMALICHNLIVETIIQGKSGASRIGMVLLRILTALTAAILLNIILPKDFTGNLILDKIQEVKNITFLETIQKWGLNMLKLIPTMFLVICSLNTAQQVLKEYKIINYLSKPFTPFMGLLGLKKENTLIWLILNTIGLAYAGSIMISERENNELSLSDAKLLNTHTAISHSLLEDTLLFFVIGIPLFWLLIPRIVLAIVAVWGQKLYYHIRK